MTYKSLFVPGYFLLKSQFALAKSPFSLLPSGKLSHNYGNSHFLMGKSTIHHDFFMFFSLENPDVPQDLSISTRRLGASVRLNAVKLPEAGNDSLRKQGN